MQNFKSNLQNVNYIKEKIEFYLSNKFNKNKQIAKLRDFYEIFVSLLNNELKDYKINTENKILNSNNKFAAYLSMEYLLGKLSMQTLTNLKIYDAFKKAFKSYNINFDDILNEEPSTQLGNGGLGRLAACFFDSFATHSYPVFGYGLLYNFGLFKQEFKDNIQIAKPDNWIEKENPAVLKTNIKYKVGFAGSVSRSNYLEKIIWKPEEIIEVTANDICVTGYNSDTCLNIRLWSSKRIDNKEPNVDKISNNLTDFLYPKDDTTEGKILRLKQEYLLTSASVQDLINRFNKTGKDISEIERYISIQLNDTHPALAIPELVRILMTEYDFDFSTAYNKTKNICSYTNHTLMAEALEKIDIKFIKEVLPFHYKILLKINNNLKANLIKLSQEKLDEIGVITKTKDNNIVLNCANLCISSTNKVNGVAALHTKLLKKETFPIFNSIYPKKFINETNGISQRKWLLETNPSLSNLITDTIGDNWITDLDNLKLLLKYKKNTGFLNSLLNIKQNNKKHLFNYIKENLGICIPDYFMVDSQIKRIHEYKRQFLNILQILDRYNNICEGNIKNIIPKVYIFAGKAHPAYKAGINIITLIKDIADVINNDTRCNKLLKVVFIPNYNIDIAKVILSASEVSEQISQAGKEASGTGNMKFALNGALTIGTLDGANIEIKENVGKNNIFIFGMNAKQNIKIRKNYNIQNYLDKYDNLNRIIIDIKSSKYGNINRYENLFKAFENNNDEFSICADFDSYIKTQKKIDIEYQNKSSWMKKSLINIANTGFFSSDRTVKGYAKDIWQIEKIKG